MTSVVVRYPGAQPFADVDTARLAFRGRDRDSRTLLNLVLAHPLVVVYAKSGLGKTSLLQAGLASPLRDENCLPLFVRVNDVSRPPLVSLTESVEREAKRQGADYRARDTTTLWHYFKTIELWREDLLQTPVLILDQFEEMFTLQNQTARAEFLRGLGHLVRGIRPDGPDHPRERDQPRISDKPPDVRVVIALREEFLGVLEEAADNIPQILDHRFRLKPLDAAGALEAVEKPAALTDERFSTKPFRYGPGTAQAIVDYLAGRNRDGEATIQRHVEPFHLQLICQRAEDIAREQQAKETKEVTVTFDDLGGVRGLKKTLSDFYVDVLRSVQPPEARGSVKRLCSDYLISPEGRRLSVEREEIQRTLSLDASTLEHLVERRLLRVDQRADRSYLELGHDSLVEPILAKNRTRGVTRGLVSLAAAALLCLLSLALAAAGVGGVWGAGLGVPTIVVGILLVSAVLWLATVVAGQGIDTLTRYLSSNRQLPAQRRRRTLGIWAVVAYAAWSLVDLIDLVIPVMQGRALEAPGGALLLLLSVKTAAMVGGAVALFGFRARAVPLFALSFLSTVASRIYGIPFFLSQYRAALDPVSAVTVSDDVVRLTVSILFALYVGVELAILGYAWWLRTRGVLR